MGDSTNTVAWRISASGPWLSTVTYVHVCSFFSACICLQLSTLLPMFTKTWHTRGHGENVRVISWLRPRENLLPQIHNRRRYINPQINACQLVNHICEMGGKKIHMCTWTSIRRREIFASLWPPQLRSLDCGWNIYGAVVRVIYPHKASAALWRRCKYGAWLAAPSSFLSSLRRWVKVAPIHRNEIRFLNGQTKPLHPFHRGCVKTLKTIPLVGLLYQLMVLPSSKILNSCTETWVWWAIISFSFLENATDVSIKILSESLSFLFSKWCILWIYIIHIHSALYNLQMYCFKDLYFLTFFFFELLKMSWLMVWLVCWWDFSHCVVILCGCLNDRK